MCTYHSNYILAVNALHKLAPSVADYDDGFVQHFLCESSSSDCWIGTCKQCTGISVEKLTAFVEFYGKIPMTSPARWMVWEKNKHTKRFEKKEKIDSLTNLISHIAKLSPQFLKHSFVKRHQSDSFNLFDLPRAKDPTFDSEALLQIDFAENFVCESQDEVQNAHWNQRQLTLFTTALFHNEFMQSKVYVSNNLTHTKETISPYLYKLLTDMPKSVKILKIWSDGPSSQFKNKYMAAMIAILEKEFDIKIFWNYFTTSHGKGCIDGIGATVKMVVRKHVRARDCIVNNASEFVSAFHRTVSEIVVEEIEQDDFDSINTILGTSDVYKAAKDIRAIASSHQIQMIGEKIHIFTTSNEGYKM